MPRRADRNNPVTSTFALSVAPFFWGGNLGPNEGRIPNFEKKMRNLGVKGNLLPAPTRPRL